MPGLIYADRVEETTATTGTGAVTLAGAVAGCRTFSSVCVDQQQVYYVLSDGTNWEVGKGTYTASTNTLSRDRVFSSSNSGNLVSLTAASTSVWINPPAATIADVSTACAFAMHLVPQ